MLQSKIVCQDSRQNTFRGLVQLRNPNKPAVNAFRDVTIKPTI